VKVLDFGIAKARGATARTEVGFVKGTYAYMSPEQVKGEELDRRSDVFALGTVLFELCTHQRLFKRSSDYLAAKAILEEAIPSASSVDPSIPAALSAVIERALARAPAERYATARELGDAIAAVIPPMTPGEIAARIAEDLQPELSQQRTRQQRVLADFAGGADEVRTRRVRGPDDKTGPTVALGPRPPRRRALWPAVAAAVVAVAAGGALAVQRCGGTAPAREARATKAAADAVPDAAAAAAAAPDAAAAAAAAPDAAAAAATATAAATAAAPAADADATSTAEDARGRARKSDRASHKPPRDRERTTPPTGTPPPDTATEPAKRAQSASGFLSIDSTPFATITLDGDALGETPLIRVRVPAGRHTLRATLRDGRTKTVTVDIPDGKLAKPINLTW
jgi:serine/threonine-protein kinase